MIENIIEDKPWDEQVRDMQTARAELYQEISLLTDGALNNPIEMADKTGEELSLWQGWRSPRPKEIRRITEMEFDESPSRNAEIISKVTAFFSNVPDARIINDSEGMIPGKEGWQSVRDITHSRVGGQDKGLKRDLMELRETMIQERMTNENVDYNKAEIWVEENRIGIYQRKGAGPATIYASPEAVERLGPVNKKDIPVAPEGWKSALMIGQENKVRHSSLVQPISDLRAEYVKEAINDGMKPEVAETWVEENRIGTYKPHRGMGTITLYASHEATTRLLREQGITPLEPGSRGEGVSGKAPSKDQGKKV